jgi:DNA-binding SARP family transcriptional activator
MMPDSAERLPDPAEEEPVTADAGAPLFIPPPTLRRGQVLFRTLGAAEIHVGGGPVIMPSAERSFSLLVLCAMASDHVLSRERLLELVWPDLDAERGRHSLRQHLYKLRSLGIALHPTRTSVTLSPSCLVPCFALGRTSALFDRDVLQGHEPFGHLFAGWIPSHAPMRQWVEQQRDRFHMDVRRVLIPELHRLRDRADWPEVERWSRTVLEFDPFNEDATLALADALAMQGGRATARHMLDGYAREIGDLGADLARQVEAAQRRIGRAGRVRHEHSATPVLIGRDEELARLDALTLEVMQGETRIVHLLGPAGIGKTELAYEATRRAVILGFRRCIVRVTRPMGEVPHGTLSRLVRDLLTLPGALGCSPETMRLLRQLSGDLFTEDDPPNSGRFYGVQEHIVDLLSAIAAEKPLVIYTDNLSDIDDVSLAVIESVWDHLRAIRILWIASSTLHHQAEQTGSSVTQTVERVQLGPLLLPHAVELVTNIRSASGREIREQDAYSIALASTRVPRDLIASARAHLTAGLMPERSVRRREFVRERIAHLSPLSRTLIQCIALLGGKASITVLNDCLSESITVRLGAFRETIQRGLTVEQETILTLASDEIGETCIDFLSQTERNVLALHLSSVLAKRCKRFYSCEEAVLALELALQFGANESFLDLILQTANGMIEAGDSQVALRYLEKAQSIPPSSENAIEVLRLLARAAERTSHWQLLLRYSPALRSNALNTNDSTNLEWELAELEASVRSDVAAHSTGIASRALAIMRTAGITSEALLRAGRIAIGAASDLFAADIAITAHDILASLYTDPDEESLELWEPAMQFHTIFGDLSRAIRVANRAEHIIGATSLAISDLRFAANAAYVLRVGGQLRRAEAVLQALWESETLQREAGRRSFVAWQLSLLAIDSNDAVSARYWMDRLERVTKETAEQEIAYWHHCHRCRVELFLTGTIADASSLLVRVQSERNFLTRSGVYSLALFLQSLSFARMTDSEKAELRQHAARLLGRVGRYVGQDLLASSVAKSLCLSEMRTEAIAVARRYLAHQRRERGDPPALLVDLAGSPEH